MFVPHARPPGTPQNPLDEVLVNAPVGGLNEAAVLDALGDTQATTALNCEFYKGTIAKRRGSVQIGDQVNPASWAAERIAFWGHQYVKKDGTSTLLAVFGTHLYKLSGSTWVGAISGTNPAGATDVFGGGKNLGSHVQYADVVYYADGDVTYRYNGTTIRPWSFAGGTMGAAVLTNPAVGGGALNAGAKTMVYTLYDSALGEETNPSTVSNSVTATANQRIEYTITKPTGYTTNFDKVRIYSTTADGSGAWYYEAEVAASDWPAGGSTALTGYVTIADSSLGAEVAYDNDPVPLWRYLQLHDERVVGGCIGTTAPSQVSWSKTNAPFAVPTTNAQYLKRDDGHPIRAVFSALFGNLYVAKQGGPIFQLRPHPTLGYAPQQLPALHGCECHQSVVADDNGAMFVDRLGIVAFNGQQTRLVSGPVQTTFRTLSAKVDTNATGDTSLLQRAVGIHDQQADRTQIRWSFAKATTGGESDDALVMEAENAMGIAGAWHREQYATRGLRVFFAVQDPSVSGIKTPAVYALDGNGMCHRLRTNASNEDVFSDVAGAITMSWYSKWFGDGLNDFIPRFVDVEIERSVSGKTTGTLYVYLWKDGDDSAAIQTKSLTLSDTGNNRATYRIDVAVPSTGQYWKRLRVGFGHSDVNGDVSIVKFAVLGRLIGRRLLGVA